MKKRTRRIKTHTASFRAKTGQNLHAKIFDLIKIQYRGMHRTIALQLDVPAWVVNAIIMDFIKSGHIMIQLPSRRKLNAKGLKTIAGRGVK